MKSTLTLLLACFACLSPSSTASIVVEHDSPVVVGTQLAEPIGLETLGGVFTTLLEKGCRLPCEITETFSTAEDNQTEIKIFLFRGPAAMAVKNHPLGAFAIVGVPAMPRGRPLVHVTLRAADGRIVMRARDSTGAPIRIERRSDQRAA